MDRPDSNMPAPQDGGGRNGSAGDLPRFFVLHDETISSSGLETNGAQDNGDSLIAAFKRTKRLQNDEEKPHCKLRDGSLRYADKEYTTQRPRPISPELRAFYQER